MRIVFHVCLLAAWGVSSSELALAASHGHRPSPAAVGSAPASEDTAKSPVTPAAPADTTPSQTTAGGKAGDMGAPIDTSITVNQGRRITGNDAVTKKLNTIFGTPVIGQSKPHTQPVPPVKTHVPPTRNAVGAPIQHADRRTTANRAPAGTGGAVPGGATPAAQPAASAAASATPTPKTPDAAAAERGAAALRAATANGPSINGTGGAKPATATAAVGGPAKAVAAAVSGSSIKPRHP
jgi:hypothetical protein